MDFKNALILAQLTLSLVAASAASGFEPDKAAGDVAYALDTRPGGKFVRHALDDFPNQSMVANSPSQKIRGVDFDPTATTLYALRDDTQSGESQFGTLGTIDLDTGAFVPIGPSLAVPNHKWTGLSVDPVTGVLYASSNGGPQSALYTLNPSTGAATHIGTDTDVGIVIDIAVNCLGEIYGHVVFDDELHRIDPDSGQSTLIGPTGTTSNLNQGMDFDNRFGTLYAYTFRGFGLTDYGFFDTDTGAFMFMSTEEGQFEGATQTTCAGVGAMIFTDGFESGDLSAW